VSVLAGFVGTLANAAAPASNPEDAITPYLTPQQVVPIGAGRTINLVCLGKGAPTVILSAGLGGWSYGRGCSNAPRSSHLCFVPARLLTQASIELEHDNSARQVLNPQRRYGDLPLIVLTAGQDEQTIVGALPSLPPGTPGASTPAELAQLRQQISQFLRDGWGAGHKAYAALSTRGRNDIVPDSSHNIPVHKPDVVISAVMKVLKESQTR